MTFPARVGRPSVGGDIEEIFERIRALEASPAGGGGTDGPWHYVGDPGEPPFVNGTNVLGVEAPVSFMKLGNGDVRIRGGFKDMSPGDIIFTLPTGYRPAYDQPLEGALADGSGAFTYIVGANGDVTFVDFI